MSPWPPKPADIPPLVSGSHEWPEREGLRVMAVRTWDDVPEGWQAVSQVVVPDWPSAPFDLFLLAQLPPRLNNGLGIWEDARLTNVERTTIITSDQEAAIVAAVVDGWMAEDGTA